MDEIKHFMSADFTESNANDFIKSAEKHNKLSKKGW